MIISLHNVSMHWLEGHCCKLSCKLSSAGNIHDSVKVDANNLSAKKATCKQPKFQASNFIKT